MEYTCRHIEGSILFDYDAIKCGCSNSGGIIFSDETSFIPKYDFELTKQKRGKIISAFKRGIAPYCCFDCCYLEKVKKCNLKISEKFKKVYISHWRHCNCSCIYCDYSSITKGKFSPRKKASSYYDFMPILKEITDRNLIDEKTEFIFMGGECSVLKEFEEIINFIEPITEQKVLIFSSSITAVPAIKTLFSKGKCMLVTSLDCGCRETYQKIKRIDAFDKVLNTIKAYKEAAGENFINITLKYILLPGINDNKEEIEKFINILKDLNIKNAFLEFDHRTFLKQHYAKFPEHFQELFDFFEQNTEGIFKEACPHNKLILEKGFIF